MNNIAIIGSGSFGCALAQTLVTNNNIKVWSFKEEEAKAINEDHTCLFIKDSKLNKNIKCYTDYKKVIEDTDYIFIVTPSNVIRKTLEDIKPYLKNQDIIICSKGLEKGTNKLLSNIAKEILINNIGTLSGPSIAKEVIEGKPCSVTFASENIELNNKIKELFKSNMKVQTSTDIIGTELGGSFKNIIALANGIVSGLNLGKNFEAALMVKGLEEMKQLGVCLGAKEETFYGLSGLGDLIVTCNSDNSRNKTAGKLFAEGKSIEEVKEEVGMVIEGLDALEIAADLVKKEKINSEIVENLYEIIYNNGNIKKLIDIFN